MRNYPSLYEMLRKETTNPNPRQAAAAMMEMAPEGATHAVLFKNRLGDRWIVLFIPGPGHPNVAQAERSRVDGKGAVATARLPDPRPGAPR